MSGPRRFRQRADRDTDVPHDVPVVDDYPPNVSELRKKFPIGPGVIFAYDGTIYNPGGRDLPIWLVEHEKVHFGQQEEAGGVTEWWARYLVDTDWRFEQELAAHIVEYREFCHYNRDRNRQMQYLMQISSRLAGEQYGKLSTTREALARIKGNK